MNGYAATHGFIYVCRNVLFTGKEDRRTVPLAYTVMEEVFDTNNTLIYQTFAEAVSAGETATDLGYASDRFGVYWELIVWDL